MEPFALYPADILLPKSGFEKWAVIACDQHTSEPRYWEKVRETVGEAPSTLKMILPEIYLNDRPSERARSAADTMRKYMDDGTFVRSENSMLYVEREVVGGIRPGIVAAVDLRDYNPSKNAASLIRATEETVPERVPPRVELRSISPLEVPHITLLIDDPKKSVIEPCADSISEFEKAYDFNLMLGGGHIAGYFLSGDERERIWLAMRELCNGRGTKPLMAVGDGNHSLAAAEVCYSANPDGKNRFALVEVINLRGESLAFEPIYRLVRGVAPEALIGMFGEEFGRSESGTRFTFLSGGRSGTFTVGYDGLPVAILQDFLNRAQKLLPGMTVDYIHGEETLRSLCAGPDTVGFLFGGMEKATLFPAVAESGSLPRKTFSMGSARDKRYYLECKEICPL